MRRTQALIAVPVVAVALLLSGCTGDSGQTASGLSGGKGTLTLGMTADLQGWDPGIQPGYQGWAAEAVWDQLVKCDSSGKLTEDIADEWSTNDDNTAFTAHIREGLEFSDGTPVDSTAVAASFEYLTKSGQYIADYKGIKIDTPDPQNITITWPQPQPLINTKACNPKITTKALLDSGKVNDTPIGSGPYVLDQAKTTRGSVYTFAKNANHWNADNYPYQNLVVKVIESDTAAVSALKTGQIDASLIPATAHDEVKASGLEVIQFQGQTTRLLLTDHLGEDIEALGDVRVRRAINMVFDKQSMADNLYLGFAEPTAQVFREGSDAYIEGLEDPYPYDVDKAKALMAEAGYQDGFELELPTMEGQNFGTLMPYVTQQLALLNIKVEEVPLSGANAIDDLLGGTYPVVLWQLGNFGDSKLQIYIEMTPEGWWNLQHQPDEYVDSRWEKIKTADPEERKRLQQEINQYTIDQAWMVPMVYTGGFYAHSPDVSIPTESDFEGLAPKLRDFK